MFGRDAALGEPLWRHLVSNVPGTVLDHQEDEAPAQPQAVGKNMLDAGMRIFERTFIFEEAPAAVEGMRIFEANQITRPTWNWRSMHHEVLLVHKTNLWSSPTLPYRLEPDFVVLQGDSMFCVRPKRYQRVTLFTPTLLGQYNY